MAAIEDPYINRAEAAEILGISVRSLERYISRRLIPQPLRIGQRGCLRWRRSTLLAFLDKQEQLAQRLTAS